MKRIVSSAIIAILFLSLIRYLFALDEDRYIGFIVDSTITLHRLKGNPKAMELWMEEMEKSHPDYMNQEWQSFGKELIQDKALRDRIYNRALEELRLKGFKARLIDLSDGITTIEIED